MFNDRDGRRPDTVDQDNLPSVLHANFNVARLLSRRRKHESPREQVADLVASLDRYKFLVGFARRNLGEDDPGVFKDELRICEEMVELMPAQIDRMHHNNESFR